MAITAPLIARIEEDAAAHQNPIRISDKRCDPTHAVIPEQGSIGTFDAIVDEGANGIIPMAVVGGVDGVLGGVCGNRQSRDRKPKHAGSTIESENMHPVAQCENEGGLGSVDDEPCAHLLVTRAQKVIRGS